MMEKKEKTLREVDEDAWDVEGPLKTAGGYEVGGPACKNSMRSD